MTEDYVYNKCYDLVGYGQIAEEFLNSIGDMSEDTIGSIIEDFLASYIEDAIYSFRSQIDIDDSNIDYDKIYDNLFSDLYDDLYNKAMSAL